MYAVVSHGHRSTGGVILQHGHTWTHTVFRLHPPASRWSQGWDGEIISCRAGGRIREDGSRKLRSRQRRLGTRINTLGAPAAWRNKRCLVALCRSKSSPWYLYPKENKTNQILGATRLTFRRFFYRWVFMEKNAVRGVRFSL